MSIADTDSSTWQLTVLSHGIWRSMAVGNADYLYIGSEDEDGYRAADAAWDASACLEAP